MNFWKLILFTTTLIISSRVSSATVVYSERTLFNQSVGTYIVDGYDSETYGWNPDDPYGTVRLTDEELNSLSPEVIYSTDLEVNWVGFAYTGQTDPGVYCSGCNLAVTMEFTNTSIGTSMGVYGVGLDIALNRASDGYPSQVRHAFVTFSDGSMIEYSLPRVIATEPALFWGISSEKLISSITFDEPDGYIARTSFIIDNLTVAANPVPIPSAIWLFGSGLISLIGLARRKANV